MNFFWSSEPVEKKKDVENLVNLETFLTDYYEETLIQHPSVDEINLFLKKKLFKKVLDEFNLYAHPDMNIFFKYVNEYDEVVQEINKVLKPDINLYELFFNNVLNELIEEYKYNYNYVSIQKDPRYDNVVLNIKKYYWSFKFNLVLEELRDTIYTFDKFHIINKHLNNVYNSDKLNIEDKMPERRPRANAQWECETKNPFSQDDIYIVMAFNSCEFSILGLFSSLKEIKVNKDILIECVKIDIKLQHKYRIIKTNVNNFNNNYAFITFKSYIDKEYLSYNGDIILDVSTVNDFVIYLEFL